jgi:hypothetical protein
LIKVFVLMGTNADFYIGFGNTAEWIGSKGFDSMPEALPLRLFNAKTEGAFRAAAMKLDSFMPASEGWPWPWKNSKLTHYTYCFHDGRVMVGGEKDDGWKWIDPKALINRGDLYDEDIFPLEEALAYGFEFPNVGCTPSPMQIEGFIGSLLALSDEQRHFARGLNKDFNSKAEYEYWLQDYWVEVCVISANLSISLPDEGSSDPVSRHEFQNLIDKMLATANSKRGEELQLEVTTPLRRMAFLVRSMAGYPEKEDWSFRLRGKGFRPESVD